ncbi:Cell wall protein pga62 [Lodderomyces elongisporus]|uniref:Uncharacterized protein n=1 Tax=Lodderomyces elongisporus (strain ATCC 11503 / CBS 2605 / JCM 1781 / NBRC 1676 / NRRL YB-4239) TaxID=379508 RepID=A5E4Y0_LODEL|nr:Cell wall protein pga62 [Lodderomyces elongisporus]EDK46488.1 predicted protein [Lodderomyces elongisporus NRRL YB-4239]WLF81600.1 Cell wall protein pga62 [Lodderomyces elongisporus]
MQFSKVAIISAVAGSAVASYNSTVTDIATTVITITSCEENKCTPVPVTTGVTTVTEIDTTYTTYCPLSTTEAPASSAPASSTVAAESSSAPAKNATVSTIEGSGARLQVGAALVGAAALLL